MPLRRNIVNAPSSNVVVTVEHLSHVASAMLILHTVAISVTNGGFLHRLGLDLVLGLASAGLFLGRSLSLFTLSLLDGSLVLLTTSGFLASGSHWVAVVARAGCVGEPAVLVGRGAHAHAGRVTGSGTNGHSKPIKIDGRALNLLQDGEHHVDFGGGESMAGGGSGRSGGGLLGKHLE